MPTGVTRPDTARGGAGLMRGGFAAWLVFFRETSTSMNGHRLPTVHEHRDSLEVDDHSWKSMPPKGWHERRTRPKGTSHPGVVLQQGPSSLESSRALLVGDAPLRGSRARRERRARVLRRAADVGRERASGGSGRGGCEAPRLDGSNTEGTENTEDVALCSVSFVPSVFHPLSNSVNRVSAPRAADRRRRGGRPRCARVVDRPRRRARRASRACE